DAGVYEVKASYLGYKTVTISNVRVNAELTTELNFKLPATGVSVGEVTIVAQRPLINKSNTNAIHSITNEEIQALPVRGVDNIVALTPGVTLQNGNIYVRGGRQDEVGYYLEGTNITNPLVSLAGGIHHSAQQVTIPQDALDEVQVQAGGYTAEYGGANAGIVRADLKSGGSSLKANVQYITDNWTFKNSSERYNGVEHLGTYSYGYNDLTASLSGPVAGNHIKLYGLFENLSQADGSPQPVNGFNFPTLTDPVTGDVLNLSYPGGPQPGNLSNRYSGVGTINLDYNPTIIRLIGTYTFQRQRIGGGTFTIFDNNRLPIQDNYNGDFGIKLTQILSENAYVDVNASYIFNKGTTYDPQLGSNFWAYGDSAANSAAGVPWPTGLRAAQYQTPRPYQLYSTFNFASPNMPLLGTPNAITNYNKFENDNLDLSAALSYNLNKQNSLKIGGEFQMMTVRNYTPTSNLVNLAGLGGSNPSSSTEQTILIKNGVNNYGYDVLGNAYNGTSDYSTGQIAPHRPIFAGAYVQDRLEYKNLIVNAGLRFDYINTDNYTFADPTNPQDVYNQSSFAVKDASQIVKVPSYSSVSPRLGFSFPITDETVFHAQYGKFVQQPSLAYLYQGIFRTGWIINPNNGFFISDPIGQNLRPTRTTNYEIGFTQQVGSVASFDITAFYKDILNQVVFGTQNVTSGTGWRPYEILANGDYSTTEGIEISFNMRRTHRFLVNGQISFENAQGTGDNPYSNAGEFGSPVGNYLYIPQFIEPLSFNHAITGNLDIDYHYGKDDGPDILHQFGASLLLTFATGHPYTLGTVLTPGTSNPDASQLFDTRNRYAIEALNSSTTPSTFTVDLMVDKAFPVVDQLSADIFIQVLNLFNTKNVQDVFSNTGSAETNGYLTNPDLTGYKQIATYGPEYANVYQNMSLQYSGLYGAPRQIRLGIRLEY
ncbi:MAG TPA: TonB-dependent receptor, partial [Ignavibacteriaceae bacterium]|nr:TonB-dependent receptor [Ignavibacteriaceae bacterium]